jgi:hypothetical protein
MRVVEFVDDRVEGGVPGPDRDEFGLFIDDRVVAGRRIRGRLIVSFFSTTTATGGEDE